MSWLAMPRGRRCTLHSFWLEAEGGHRVGTCVVDPYGSPPEDIWGLTISLLKSPRFQAVSLGLICGQPVCSADAEVQISFQQVSETRLNIRIREADSDLQTRVLDLVVEAIDPADLDHPDQRGLASPVPNGWMQVRSDTKSDWELYNCRIRSLKASNP